MAEKVLWLKLPRFKEVKIAEDGRIGIVYKEIRTVVPKPEPLLGGTEVYKKNKRTKYWYCKIKGERDEFMHLYFADLTEDDLLYEKTGVPRRFETPEKVCFREYALEALANKPKEGFRWIPVCEPSSDKKGGIQFVEGELPLGDRFGAKAWDKVFEEYSPENESQTASIHTYFLLLLRWLKDGIATFEQLVEDSTKIGHFSNSQFKSRVNEYELTGKRMFGGLCGIVGNTFKYVKKPDPEQDFYVGGSSLCSGNRYKAASVCYKYKNESFPFKTVGLLELKK